MRFRYSARLPWVVYDDDGRVMRRFPTYATAERYSSAVIGRGADGRFFLRGGHIKKFNGGKVIHPCLHLYRGGAMRVLKHNIIDSIRAAFYRGYRDGVKLGERSMREAMQDYPAMPYMYLNAYCNGTVDGARGDTFRLTLGNA